MDKPMKEIIVPDLLAAVLRQQSKFSFVTSHAC